MDTKKIEIAIPTPVLNTPDYDSVFGGKKGNAIPLDEKGHPIHYEFIALKGAVFELLGQHSTHIFKAQCAAYPSSALYLDRRFFALEPHNSSASQHKEALQLPPIDIVFERMRARLGTPYLWGGNWADGIPELLSFYPPKQPLNPEIERIWSWKGLDCSGLLYEATRGATPRNTSELVHFGKPLKFSGLNSNEIIKRLRPLDMIVYCGHVLFVYDSRDAIESKASYGVIRGDLKQRLDELMSKRQLVDHWDSITIPQQSFVIRRIY